MKSKKRGLGRGLNALLPNPDQIPTLEASPVAMVSSPQDPSTEMSRAIREISIDQIEVNPFQPRHQFDPQGLEDLAKSIRVQGILQPILVRPSGRGYEILVGERRWRAARMAELNSIPAVVHDVDDAKAHEWALIENLQREDLNAIEEARAYQTLMAEFGLNQEEVAQRVGKDRSSIANAVRLLSLSSEFIEDINEGRLSAGHGRVLLALNDDAMRRKLRNIIVNKSLSVRQAEAWGQSAAPDKKKRLKADQEIIDPDLKKMQDKLEEHLKTRVAIRPKARHRGKVEIMYNSLDDFERIVQVIGVSDGQA